MRRRRRSRDGEAPSLPPCLSPSPDPDWWPLAKFAQSLCDLRPVSVFLLRRASKERIPPPSPAHPSPGLRRAALLAKSAAESLRGRSMERCEGDEPEPAEAPPGTRLLLAFKAFLSSRKGLLLLAQAVSGGGGGEREEGERRSPLQSSDKGRRGPGW